MVGAALVRIAMVVLKKYVGIYRWVAFFIFFLGVASIARTGFYGGELVYKHAAGVKFDLGFGNLE
jgi:drug/metabolite transporter (DMT)-like permease